MYTPSHELYVPLLLNNSTRDIHVCAHHLMSYMVKCYYKTTVSETYPMYSTYQFVTFMCKWCMTLLSH